MADNVEHPIHYQNSSIEAIDIIRLILGKEGFEAFCKGNVIKYLARYKLKNGTEDLNKAGWYLKCISESDEDYTYLYNMITKATIRLRMEESGGEEE